MCCTHSANKKTHLTGTALISLVQSGWTTAHLPDLAQSTNKQTNKPAAGQDPKFNSNKQQVLNPASRKPSCAEPSPIRSTHES